jgi:hypothetical protein
MNFEGKRIKRFRLLGSEKEIKKESRVMEYHCINEIDYGFFESKKRKEFFAIHLDSGLSVVSFEIYEYNQEQGFKVLFEKVKALPRLKIEKALPNAIKRIKDAGLTYPVND